MMNEEKNENFGPRPGFALYNSTSITCCDLTGRFDISILWP